MGTQLPSKKGGTVSQFSAHVSCGQTLAHLSYCWALVCFLTHFLCFVTFAVPFLSTEMGPHLFQARCQRRWRNLGLVFCVDFVLYVLFMAALWNRAGRYIFALWFLLLSSFFFLFFLPNLSRRTLDIPYFHTGCGLSANLSCRSETCCMWLAKNTGCKILPKIWHLGTITQLVRLYLHN